MKVEPTTEDVQYAESQSRWACIIVRAIQRQIPDSTFVRVDKNTIAYSSHGHRYFHPTPPKMIEDIIKPFDEHRTEDIILGEYPLIVDRVKKVAKLTPENKVRLRNHERVRSAKNHPKVNRTHDRFCET